MHVFLGASPIGPAGLRSITNKLSKELTEHTVKVILTSRVLSKKNFQKPSVKPSASATASSSDAGEPHAPREGVAVRLEAAT